MDMSGLFDSYAVGSRRENIIFLSVRNLQFLPVIKLFYCVISVLRLIINQKITVLFQLLHHKRRQFSVLTDGVLRLRW